MPRYAQELTDAEEIAIWEKILEREGTTFVTSGRENTPGVSFTYEIPVYRMEGKTVKGAELRISSRSKTITRSTVMLAHRRVKEILEAGEEIKGPKQLGVYGSSYLFAIFREVGVIPGNIIR